RHIRDPIWYLDSGCSRSMTGVKSYLHKYVEQSGPKVVFGDNSSCITQGYGSINCGGIVFSKVAFVNGLKHNLIRISQLCPRRNDVYVLDMSSLTPNGACLFVNASDSEDDQSIQYQSNYDISHYIIPHGHLLTELIQDNHVPEVITLNEQNTPHTEDDEGPPGLINTKGTHEYNVQDKKINYQPTGGTLGNNTETSVPYTGPSVPEVTQSQNTRYASTRSYAVAQDRWSRDQHIKLINIIGDPGDGMLIRSMDAKLTATSAIWNLVPLPYGKIASGSEWVFRNKKDEVGTVVRNKARLVAQGELSYVLGLQIKQDDKGISICQEKYTRDLLKKYEISNSFLVKTPMVPPNNLGPNLAGKPVNKTLYRGMIGSLMYLAASKPDIHFSTCLYARYQANLKESHLIAVKRIFRKITLGACQMLGGKLVCWSVKK
ncbi:hypothetical protein Tco_1411360, partial [Tanacetum coccineum]